MDVENMRHLIRSKGATPVSYRDSQLEDFASVLVHHDLAEYLRYCQTVEDYEASGIYVGGDLDVLRKSNIELGPGAYIFPHGFLCIASDVGGNEVCVDVKTGYVYFVRHSSFDEDMVYTRDEETGELLDLPVLNHDNILLGLVLLSEEFEAFMGDLLNDRLTSVLDELD